MRLSLLVLGLSAAPLAAGASHWKSDQRRIFHHIGAQGVACGEQPSRGLRLEDLPGEGIFRVFNEGTKAVRFHYDHENFGDYAMFFIRVRDASGKIIDIDGGVGDCGWWSPKSSHSDLFQYGEWPRRRVLHIPGMSSIAIKRDPVALLAWAHHSKVEKGPCQMQVKLFGYLGRRTWRGVTAVGDWGPSPCPGPAKLPAATTLPPAEPAPSAAGSGLSRID